MCRLVSIALLTLLSSSGCATVALNSFPDRYDVSQSPGSTNIDLYVGAVNFRAVRPISQGDQAHFKSVLISHIAKSHYFRSVRDRSQANPVPGSRYVVMDAEVSPREEGEFRWSVTWPAVYPMPLYWPVQSKHGTVSVSIESVFFDQDGTRFLDLRGEKTNDYQITFYGFFRTGPAEDQLRQSYQDALAALIQKMTTEGSVMTALTTKRAPGPAAVASAAPSPMVPRVLAGRLNNKRLAVLEFQSRNINEDVLMALSDNVRGGALQGIAGSGMSIMTRENMLVLLKDMGKDACSEGDCEVETARNIGADYVVSGKVVVVEGVYVVTLKLHETKDGSLIGTEVVEGKSQVDVLHLLREHGRQLMTTAFAQ